MNEKEEKLLDLEMLDKISSIVLTVLIGAILLTVATIGLCKINKEEAKTERIEQKLDQIIENN